MSSFLREFVPVPESIAVCPECGFTLMACANEWEVESGRPTEEGLQVDCFNPDEDAIGWHQFYQSDWQGPIDRVWDWVNKKFEEKTDEE